MISRKHSAPTASSSGAGAGAYLLILCCLAFTLAPAAALSPSHVSGGLCPGAADGWEFKIPKTTPADVPHFNFTLAPTKLFPHEDVARAESLRFFINGSLGLPGHPLGIFKFEANGSACGESQDVYILDGVLGRVRLSFPPCISASPRMSGVVDVWTPLPVAPPSFATAFEFQLRLVDTSTSEDLACANLEIAGDPATGAEKSQDKCGMPEEGNVPVTPPAAQQIPHYTIDLDAAPEDRWTEIVKSRADGMRALINTFSHNRGILNRTILSYLLNQVATREMRRMPVDFVKEMEGIANTTGIGVGFIWVINMMYELSGYCTSTVVQDADGVPWHARNLDFGLFMGTDPVKHTWSLTQRLRDLLVNVAFVKDGKVLYNATTYAGFVGLLSGSKAGAFSITVDTRYDDTLLRGVIGWLLGKNSDCQFLTFETRQVMESAADYDTAISRLLTYKALGPAYVIIAGTRSGEGAVIAKRFNASAEKSGAKSWPNADVWYLKDSLANGSFYVLETNYDRTGPPPGFDDRRFPAENCLEGLGPGGINAHSLMGVLSANPTLNALTTFSTVMSPAHGHYEARKQECIPGPNCKPF